MNKLYLVFFLLFFGQLNAQNTYIPNNLFEQALIDLGLDDILDDYVLTSSIDTVNSLDISNKLIGDLTGIEDFALLTNLYCDSNLFVLMEKLIISYTSNIQIYNELHLDKDLRPPADGDEDNFYSECKKIVEIININNPGKIYPIHLLLLGLVRIKLC